VDHAVLSFWLPGLPNQKERFHFPSSSSVFLFAAAIKTVLPQLDLIWHPLNCIARQSLVVTLFLIGSGLSREVLARTGIKPLAHGIVLWIIVSVASAAAILSGWIS